MPSDVADVSTDEDASVDTDSSTAKWRLFEKTIAAAEAELDRGSIVKHNQHLVGQESGTLRQIDVLAFGKIVRADLAVVIECKRYSRRIGIGKVDEFIGKLQDIGSSHGILYAYTGVTEPARRRAAGARRPTVEIRDFTETEAELKESERATAQAATEASFEQLLATVAQRRGEDLARTVERQLAFNCEAGTGCHGVVDMEVYDDEIPWGVCDECASLHLLCECDGSLLFVHNQGDTEGCWCGAQYSVAFTPSAELNGVRLERHARGCDGNHPDNLLAP